MIIDYKADSHFAKLFRPADAETGELLDFPIMYADDVEGVIRYYKRSGPNIFVRDPETGGPISIEEKRKILLVPTDGNPLKDSILKVQGMIRDCNGCCIDDALTRRIYVAELDALAWKAAYMKLQDYVKWLKQ